MPAELTDDYEWNDHRPKCPWCGDDQDQSDPFGMTDEGETVDCEACGKPFRITSVSLSFRTEKAVPGKGQEV